MMYFSLLLCIIIQSLCRGDFIGDIVKDFNGDNFDLSVYHSFDEIIDYLHWIQSRYPLLVQLQQIGTTFENNPIQGLKIGSPGVHKPAIWIDSCIHAREWVAAATSLYIIDHLVKGYHTNVEIRQLLDAYDWHIFPVLNPDGYIYSRSTDRLWRKNRSPNTLDTSMSDCRGTDLNRNFDIDFEGHGNSSTDPCSDYYRGKAPFSEQESRAIRDGIWKIGDRLKLCITLHSFGQLWMSPYGFKEDYPPDHEDHMKVLEKAVSAIKNVNGETYTPGTIYQVKHVTGGSSTDWVYVKAKVKYSFAVELRDTGEHGYVLPNTLIIPTAEETFAAIKVVAATIQSEF